MSLCWRVSRSRAAARSYTEGPVIRWGRTRSESGSVLDMNECDLRQLEITLPFPPRPHLSGARAQRHAQHWATRFGLLADERAHRRFESLGYGRFASYWCSGASFADLVLLAEWITLFFIFDDLQ